MLKAVRKAYLDLAAGCHPDKCPDDPSATATFQLVRGEFKCNSHTQTAEAYEVLSEADTRVRYDAQLNALAENRELCDDEEEESVLDVVFMRYYTLQFPPRRPMLMARPPVGPWRHAPGLVLRNHMYMSVRARMMTVSDAIAFIGHD